MMATKLNISKIEISNLFDMFDYDIKLNDKLTIITAPNGYGKSTILRMINNFTSGNYYSFLYESFSKVVFYLTENDERNEKKNKQLEFFNGLNEGFKGLNESFKVDDDLFDLFDLDDSVDLIRHRIEIIKTID